MRTGYGGPLGPGVPPGVPSIGGNESASGEMSAGGEFSGSDGSTGYARGGPVRRRPRRRRFRRPRRMLAQRPGMMRRRRPRPMRRPVRRPRPRTGYAAGGTVNPTLMSVSLDSRSNNPSHYTEDREALSTRPEGAPEAPDAFGYEEGGEVEDDDDEEDTDTEEPVDPWVEPVEESGDDDEDLARLDDDDAIPETPDMQEGEEQEELADEEGRYSGEGEQEGEEPEERGDDQPEGQPGEPGERGGGGGAGAGERAEQPTGYQQAQLDEAEQPAAQPDTGFDQQAPRTPTTPLKEVLDHTRRQLGVDQPAQAAEAPADQQLAAASAATAQAAAPSGQAGTTGPDQTAAEPTLPQPPATPQEPAQRVPAPPRAPAGPTQPSGTQSGPGNMQAIQDYVSGKGGFTPEQMTDLLDRTNQTNPDLGQNGAIHAAFKNLVDKNDMDGASKFVQALRPSYDKVRALMIAATSQGDFDGAMKLAEQLNNLVPNGQQARFTQLQDGRILATVQPQDGGAITQFALTPEQFGRYANSPLSLFDHAAEQGLEKNFTMLTGQPGQQAQPQYASANMPMPSDSGQLTMNDASQASPPYISYPRPAPGSIPPIDPALLKRMEGPPGPERTAQAAAPVQPAPVAAPAEQPPLPRPRPATGYSPEIQQQQRQGPAAGVGESEWARRIGTTVHPSGFDPSGAPAFSSRRVPGYGPGLREQTGDPSFYDPNYRRPGGQQPVYPTTTGSGRISAEEAVRARTAAPDVGAPPGDRYGPGYPASMGTPGVLPEVMVSNGRIVHQGGQPPAQQAAETTGQATPTGYSAGQRQAIGQAGQQILDEHAQRTGTQPQVQQGGQPRQQGQLQPPAPMRAAPQQQPRESEADRDYRIKMRAYEAFPYSNQRDKRGQYEQRLYLQEMRQQGRGGGGDKMAIEQGKQDNLNYRAQLVAQSNAARTQAMRDNNWITAATKALTAGQREYFLDYRQRQRAWQEDQKLKQTNEPYVSPDKEQAARDTMMFQRLFTDAAKNGLDFTQPQTPARGGQRERPPAPGTPAPQNAPVTPAPSAPGQPPQWMQKIDLKTYRGEKPPQQLTPEERQNWQWFNTEEGEWTLQPRQKRPQATPAKPPAPRSAAPPLELPMMP